MRLNDLNIDLDRLAGICRRYHVARLEAFGSFASGEAGNESDLDMLVTFESGVSFITVIGPDCVLQALASSALLFSLRRRDLKAFLPFLVLGPAIVKTF